MQRLCIDSSCSYLGKSVLHAACLGSAGISNDAGDEVEGQTTLGCGASGPGIWLLHAAADSTCGKVWKK